MEPLPGGKRIRDDLRTDCLLHRSPLTSGRSAPAAATYTEVNERPKVTNRHLYMLFAVILTLAFTAGVARADFKAGDPRNCALEDPGQPHSQDANCARGAAQFTLRGFFSKQLGLPAYNWTSNIVCNSTQTNLLKWTCHWGQIGKGGSAVIVFKALSTGWHRYVTLVRCDDATKTDPPGCR